MFGGFQVGPFQTNFQQVSGGVVVSEGGSWQDHVSDKYRKQHLKEIRVQERQLKKVEKKIANVLQKISIHRTDGVLANLHRLELKREEIKARIFRLNVEFKFPDFNDDEDDIEAILFDS